MTGFQDACHGIDFGGIGRDALLGMPVRVHASHLLFPGLVGLSFSKFGARAAGGAGARGPVRRGLRGSLWDPLRGPPCGLAILSPVARRWRGLHWRP